MRREFLAWKGGKKEGKENTEKWWWRRLELLLLLPTASKRKKMPIRETKDGKCWHLKERGKEEKISFSFIVKKKFSPTRSTDFCVHFFLLPNWNLILCPKWTSLALVNGVSIVPSFLFLVSLVLHSFLRRHCKGQHKTERRRRRKMAESFKVILFLVAATTNGRYQAGKKSPFCTFCTRFLLWNSLPSRGFLHLWFFFQWETNWTNTFLRRLFFLFVFFRIPVWEFASFPPLYFFFLPGKYGLWENGGGFRARKQNNAIGRSLATTTSAAATPRFFLPRMVLMLQSKAKKGGRHDENLERNGTGGI